jgi:hypothetical protein
MNDMWRIDRGLKPATTPRGSGPRGRGIFLAISLLALAAASASAQAQEPAAPRWEFSLTPYLWIAGVTGSLQTPNPRLPAQNVSAGFGDVLSHLNAIPIMGAAELRYGRFGVMTDIIAISVKSDVSTDGVLFTGGSARVTQVMGSAVAAYRILEQPGQSLDLGIGVRAIGLSSKFTVDGGALPGFSRTPGVSWANAIGAIRYHLDFSPSWGVTAYGDIGGAGSASLTWQLLATVDYRWSEATSLRIGYRHIQFRHDGPALQQNMGLSGPILGATIRF